MFRAVGDVTPKRELVKVTHFLRKLQPVQIFAMWTNLWMYNLHIVPFSIIKVVETAEITKLKRKLCTNIPHDFYFKLLHDVGLIHNKTKKIVCKTYLYIF